METEPSFLKARRLRAAVDDAIQRFRRMVAPLPKGADSASSNSFKVDLLIAEVHKEFARVLPLAEVPQYPNDEWQSRLVKASAQLAGLSQKLGSLQSELAAAIDVKIALCKQIEASKASLAGLL